MMRMKKKRIFTGIVAVCIALTAMVISDYMYQNRDGYRGSSADAEYYIPEYSGMACVEVNNNIPFFEEGEFLTEPFEVYSEWDALGRCGVAYANISQELMPTEERGAIGMVKPTGWHTVKYNGVVDGNYLYNRCHLIAYCLAAENANKKNLITGTRISI